MYYEVNPDEYISLLNKISGLVGLPDYESAFGVLI